MLQPGTKPEKNIIIGKINSDCVNIYLYLHYETPATYILMYCNASSLAFTGMHYFQFKT